MKKHIALSFDDGRLDTYTVALPIIKKYGSCCTINIASDFILNPGNYMEFASANGLPMSKDMVIEAQREGMEIALHGHTHGNTVEDIRMNKCELASWGVNTGNIGFASPHSYITKNNIGEIGELLQSGEISYVRSGIQTRREGFLYCVLQVLQEKTGSPWLFWKLNRKMILDPENTSKLIFSVAITRYTTIRQLKYFLSRIPDNGACVLMFHSILAEHDPARGADKWYWDSSRFEKICDYLANDGRFSVIKTVDLFKEQ